MDAGPAHDGDAAMADAAAADGPRQNERASTAADAHHTAGASRSAGRGASSGSDAVKMEDDAAADPASKQPGAEAPADGAVADAMPGADGAADGAAAADKAPEAPKETMEEAAARRRADSAVLRQAAAIREAAAKAAAAAQTPPYEAPRRRCHWDYLLAEMAWMAADFAGERLWKLHAAAQLAAAASAADGSPKIEKTAEEERRKAAVSRAHAGVTEFWLRMKARASTPAADAPAEAATAVSALPRGAIALEAWAVQSLRERLAASASGTASRLGDDDALPFEGLSLPEGDALAAPSTPLLWTEPPPWVLSYAANESATGGALLTHAAAAEQAAHAAFAERLAAWEEAERQRQRAAAEAARAAREEEESRAALAKQQAAAAAAAATAAAAAMPGGGYPMMGHHTMGAGGYAAAEWDAERRRKKSKKGLYGYEEDDGTAAGAMGMTGYGGMGLGPPGMAGMAGIPSKRMRTSAAAASAARAAAAGDGLGAAGRYAYMGGYAMPPVAGMPGAAGKRRKGDEADDAVRRAHRAGEAGGDRRGDRSGRKARPPGAPLAAPVVPWSPAEDQLLQAIEREFCRPRPNWALVSDVLAQGAPFRGVFRRPEQCRAHWDQLSRAQGAAAAAGAPIPGAEGAEGTAPPPEAEPREDDAARNRRRQVLASLLPIEQELLKLHLERLCLVAARQRARRAADAAPDPPPLHRAPPNASWAALTAGVDPLRGPVELAEEPLPVVVPMLPGGVMQPGMPHAPPDARHAAAWAQPAADAAWAAPGAAAAAPSAQAPRRGSGGAAQHAVPSPPAAAMAPPARASKPASKSRARSGSRVR